MPNRSLAGYRGT